MKPKIVFYLRLLLIFGVVSLFNISEANAQWEDDWDWSWVEDNWDNIPEGTYYFGDNNSPDFYTDPNGDTFYVLPDGSQTACPSCDTGGYDGYGVMPSNDDFIDYIYDPIDEGDPIMGYNEDEGRVYYWDETNEEWVTEDPTDDTKSTVDLSNSSNLTLCYPNGSCWERAKTYMENAGDTPGSRGAVYLLGSETKDNEGNHTIVSNGTTVMENAISAIDRHLEADKTIMVGVDYTHGTGINEGTTDHFVVITGRGYDENNNLFYSYVETGRSEAYKEDACNPDNCRFYYDEENNTFGGDKSYGSGDYYTVIQVRPNDGNTDGTTNY